ncbi:hypothetical protein [Legionella maioricensis]|uniref:Uncharacterized protein n=1 Tax=Legionella maioricensis TaxID=2896528 RepID=A0A9X2D3E7_9GAMM|nr:hypothetical protein [Legionella maioricensis]MCL9685634.1 hypothetical protein [Legionella maioricensis]MCL9689043.1 hypothetical protein [Legionella maioricensis]
MSRAFTFEGIHNSLKIAVQHMSEVFDYVNSIDAQIENLNEQTEFLNEKIELVEENIECLEEQIEALEEAVDLADATMQYVGDNKSNDEKNPEGLADKLADQAADARKLIAILEMELKYTQEYLRILDEEQDCQALEELMNAPLTQEEESRLKQEEQDRLKIKQLADELIPVLEDHFFTFPEIEKIDLALGMLLSKTDSIGKRAEVAKDVANVLYSDLLAARNTYKSSLISGKAADGEEVTPEEARQIFKGKCNLLIMEAMPILEKDDLSWGDFLKNLMKAIANAVIKVASGFTVHNFFKPVQSTKEIITEASDELQSDFQSAAPI